MTRWPSLRAALLLPFVAGCSDAPATLTIDRTHDFVSLLGEASFSAGSPYQFGAAP